VSSINSVVWTVVDFLQTYDGAVTAVATVIIAAFTIVLVVVTNRQARLTKESVEIANRALTELEAPVAPNMRPIERFEHIVAHCNTGRTSSPLRPGLDPMGKWIATGTLAE
jgi:hypothetical protein